MPSFTISSMASVTFLERTSRLVAGHLLEGGRDNCRGIEEVTVEALQGAPGLCVRLRQTWDEDDHALEEALRVAAVRWVREGMMPGT